LSQTPDAIPPNLASLHAGEEFLRSKAIGLVAADERLKLHLGITEATMDLVDILRQFDTTDEDLKVIQLLGMRTFNAFGASVKLALSGYSQNSALTSDRRRCARPSTPATASPRRGGFRCTRCSPNSPDIRP